MASIIMFYIIKSISVTENISVARQQHGAVLNAEVSCFNCGARYERCTSQKEGQVYHLNYLLSCVIIFTGSLIQKSCR